MFFSLLIPILVFLRCGNQIIKKIFFYGGQLSFGVYLIHLTIFQFTYDSIHNKNNFLILLITYIMAITLSFISAYLFNNLEKNITKKLLILRSVSSR